MIIYTPMPLEIVLDGVQQNRCYKEIQVDGVKLQVEELQNGQYRINQLLSTDPSDFLNPKFQPGNLITYENFKITKGCESYPSG